jgi:7-carboxy-7-deazaguanine synthase
MLINEIFQSIQGESSYSGFPCTFIRVTGCNLRCSYCDTTYAYHKGINLTIAQIVREVRRNRISLVEITGGEPLLNEEVYPLIEKLLSEGYKILVETNGSIDISRLNESVVRIIDIKCPSSKMSHKMYWKNMDILRPTDEIKFVVKNRSDYVWSRMIINKYKLKDKVKINLSPVHDVMDAAKLAEWMLEDKLPARLQIQMHKYIWPGREEGV